MLRQEDQMAGNHNDLIFWRRAMDLAQVVYRYTKSFPREETYDLAAQLGRASVSIPSNIAEGRGRYSSREMSQFLVHARGSLLELETQIEIARELEYIGNVQTEGLLDQCSEVGRLLNGMLNHFKQPLAVR
jgi:four helix bundle protein